ncbi:MAG: GTP cyclohydrolase FolE2 [Methanophagales archaeon]|nr:GTP cyclohydrolase, FolE2/MptA family [Methanophagales archaeon]MCU4140274.1 GTP cyclohydrolase FolE2 [Methanophagales archaeon]
MKHLPDVQASSPEIPLNLTRVGVRNVKKLVELARKGGKRPIVLVSTFDIFVDLPSSMKGANLSRNFEAMYEVLESAVNTPFYEIEELCVEVAKRLLQRHKYASVAEVRMRSEFIAKRKTPVTAMECQEPVVIFAEAKAFREESGGIAQQKRLQDAARARGGGGQA